MYQSDFTVPSRVHNALVFLSRRLSGLVVLSLEHAE